MAVPFLNSITLNKNEVQDFKVYNIGTGNPTLSSGGDIGYFWTDTTGSKVLKWWDGSAVRTILDSASTTIVAADLSGGSAGSLPYQQGASDTTFLGIGTAGQVLKVNSGATAPEWTAQSNLSVGTATFLAGGTAGDIPVQSAAGTTGFLNIGANGRILTSNGSTPVWSATIPSSAVSGLAASATTDTTNASNISSGTLSLGRLSLANGQFYVGDASNNPAATAKTSIPLSGFGAATADVSMGTYKITNLGTPLSTDPDSTAATKGYVDSVAQGLDVKASCVVASTTNITLASPGSITIDGVSSATFTSGVTRILVKDQSAQAENGIYIWNGTGSAMTRSLDANTWDELVGAFTFIETGTANADSGWVCNVNAGGTLGTTAVTWTKFSQAGSYTAGNGMVLSGGVFHFAQDTNYTAGRIPFASGNTTIGFSSNLFWDNTNNRLGIGTATVDGKVHIYGDTYANSQLRIQRNGAVNGTFSIGIAGTNNTLYIQDEVNATARLIIDGSGNLGLGVTPSAWGSSYKAIQMGQVGSINYKNFIIAIGGNYYNNGTNDVTLINGYRSKYEQDLSNGTHIWYQAGIDTGNVSWNQSMTLDASGNLGVGETTPLASLHVKGANGAAALFLRGANPSTQTAAAYIKTPVASGYSTTAVYGFWYQNCGITNPDFETIGFNLNGSEMARFASDGKLLLKANGTASAPTIANADNPDTGLYWPTDADTLALAVGGSDAIYIDSSRRVLLGSNTSPVSTTGGVLYVAGNALSAPSTDGSSQAITVGGYQNSGELNQSIGVFGHIRGYLLLGSNYSSGQTDLSGIKFLYGPRSTTSENTASISRFYCTNTTTDSTSGGSLVFETRPTSGTQTERLRIKSTGQLNFNGLASDPAGAAGDVYYNSGSNVFKVYDTGWKTLPRKYVVQLSDGSVTVLGNAYTITHNLGSQDVTVSIRRTTDNAVVQADVVMPAGGNTVTVTFAAAITAAQFYVTVIG